MHTADFSPSPWAAAGFVDTDLSFLRFLELYGATVSEHRMTARRVVEPFDVVEHFGRSPHENSQRSRRPSRPVFATLRTQASASSKFRHRLAYVFRSRSSGRAQSHFSRTKFLESFSSKFRGGTSSIPASVSKSNMSPDVCAPLITSTPGPAALAVRSRRLMRQAMASLALSPNQVNT